ncbi:CapA family protein [Clostridium polynesiense]|uniref:CapA family protein n=1 Tax=Clostridium polynesiense TaxID=1325933 RepID=UPI0006935173|nr:CapA family protein [Clostridium polynesiense]
MRRNSKLISGLLILLVILSGCSRPARVEGYKLNESSVILKDSISGKDIETLDDNGKSYVDITISSVGDVLIHSGIYKSAYDEKSKTYDFKEQFKYVKPLLEKADITAANLETTLSGAEAGYSGYPTFNSPDSIVDALKDCGIDILAASNNHRLDKGEKGFKRTIDTVRNKGLDIIGIRKSEDEISYVIREVKGVKVGFINFGYESKLKDGTRTLNGIPIPLKLQKLMDTIDYGNLQEGYKKAENIIKEVKEHGAEILIAFTHWGQEYQGKPDTAQKNMALKLCELDVDLIFGAHPHVLQPAEVITSKDKETLVFYSQGNFISSQRLETIKNIYSEQGMIASASIRYFKDGKKEIIDADYVPTWVNYKNSPKLIYEVIPAEEAIKNKAAFKNLTTKDIERINYCKETVDKLMDSMETKTVFKKQQ